MGQHDLTRKGIEIPDIIGLPPINYHSPSDGGELIARYQYETMPLMAIYPKWTKVKEGDGLHLFTLDHGEGLFRYNKILAAAGVPEGAILDKLLVSFLNNAAISESFGNEYSESKFESIGNMASDNFSELVKIAGQDSVGEAMTEFTKNMGIFTKTAGAVAGAVAGVGEDVLRSLIGKDYTEILKGGKLDFPQLWKNAHYTPSYSFTIRLYCPQPGDDDIYYNSIIVPLAQLIGLAVPISTSQNTFNMPVLSTIMCPGMFEIEAGFVRSLEVLKGGDSNDFSFIQRPGTIDVKLTFGELYNTMIADTIVKGEDGEEGESTEEVNGIRPTFKKYISNLKNKTPSTLAEAYHYIVQAENVSFVEVVEEVAQATSSPDDSTSGTDASIGRGGTNAAGESNTSVAAAVDNPQHATA